jgi:hypothetical protein
MFLYSVAVTEGVQLKQLSTSTTTKYGVENIGSVLGKYNNVT